MNESSVSTTCINKKIIYIQYQCQTNVIIKKKRYENENLGQHIIQLLLKLLISGIHFYVVKAMSCDWIKAWQYSIFADSCGICRWRQCR